MRKMLEYIAITGFFILSLIYTNKIANIIKSEDPIMKSIVSNMDKYEILTINAEVTDDTIIPGVSGCTVDINESYKRMKKINEYNDSLLKYKDLIPEISLNSIYSKYIINGNKYMRKVAIVINIKKSIDKSSNIANANKVKLNLFLDSELLKSGAIKINTDYLHIYNGGSNNNYDDITIEWMNDVIIDNYNNPKYCININKNTDNLLMCSKNRMHSINPKIIVNNSNVYESKLLIGNGSIIYFEESSINNVTNIINYVKSKGYDIVYLDELLEEKTCNK